MANERNGVAGSSSIFFQFIWRIGTIFKRTWIKEDIKEVGEGIKKKKKEGRKEEREGGREGREEGEMPCLSPLDPAHFPPTNLKLISWKR